MGKIKRAVVSSLVAVLVVPWGGCNGSSASCMSNADCPAATPICDPVARGCVAGQPPMTCGASCGCTTGACNLQCATGTSCNLGCSGGSSCNTVSCAKATCAVDCSGGSSCDHVDCSTATSCNVDCSGGSRCNVDCTNAMACGAKCSGGSPCAIDCTGSKNCTFSECSGGSGQKMCSNGVVVCNRDCPVCGDKICDAFETCESCPQDCGACK